MAAMARICFISTVRAATPCADFSAASPGFLFRVESGTAPQRVFNLQKNVWKRASNVRKRGMTGLAPFLISILLMGSAVLEASTLPDGFSESRFGGTSANIAGPTAMAFAPDGRLFVCQQDGRLRVIKQGNLLATPFLTVSVDAQGERGLLGIAFDPNFTANQFVYVYYTTQAAPVHNRVSRFTAAGDVAVAGSETIIFELDNLSGATNHNGGAIHFGKDGKLYIGVGENANTANAQTLNNVLGKMLRINSDGTPPSDNPFFGQAV